MNGMMLRMIGNRKFFLILLLLLATRICFATSYFGASASVVTKSSEPQFLHGYQLTLNYDPQCFQWRRFNIYFDIGYAHYWINYKLPYASTISVYSIAPVIRYTLRKRCSWLRPFIELSIGFAYLNHTRFAERNIGMHPEFQDRIGFGAFIGPCEQLSLGLHALHYSNAHLCEHNSGITIPIMLDLGYRW